MMKIQPELTWQRLPMTVQGIGLDIASISREGTGEPVVFLHGFGSSKEDYADFVRHRVFEGQPFIAWDAPGCGESQCADYSKMGLPFLLETALKVISHAGFTRFHLVGHSMGGLTSLLLAHAFPERVLSFVNIGGNIAPEDCFLSRQIVQYAEPDAERFFARFIERTRQSPAWASALYASSLPQKVRAQAVPGIFSSMVDYSDHGELMAKFLNLPCPKMFMYGDQNAGLSYLSSIARRGVKLAEIPHYGHFPMYSNSPEMWRQIALLQQASR
ncbi:alpha/beta fold hydrolase [Klebsiella oxytoca]|uniref:alpha/beta fold hydrolase n=1 Tax=Klebsiella oxytoca TaxID=571 RepID=UPI002247C40C|nr:alpha/beta hydrolase [Klebsiella oxytoca]MCW9635623.1 alpha/beta hydrolase [Klebsiella oxytoca]